MQSSSMGTCARPARAEPVAHASRAARGVAKAVRAKGKEDDWEEF